jgi:L-alanine-DL-glutamate epimerase-like enolase superfamily enzyme
VWAGASVGRSGLAVQAIAAFDVALWDMKARRAALPLAKLLGAHRDAVPCYNTSGGFLHTPLPQVLANVESLARTRHRRHQDQGRPARHAARLRARQRGAQAPGRRRAADGRRQPAMGPHHRAAHVPRVEPLRLVWIEEPLDAYDAEGHAAGAALDTPIATGEMLTSAAEHAELIRHRSADFI